MNYTKTNWTVSSLYKDTIQVSKKFDIPDMSFSTDFKKSSDEPTEATIVNVTGSEITSMEQIRYGASDVKNIYTGVSTDPTCMLPSKKGVQTLVEVSENYRATNTVTGEEFDLPCKGRIVLRFPTHQCVTEEMVLDLLRRTISAAFAKGLVSASREIEIARGSLLPDGL